MIRLRVSASGVAVQQLSVYGTYDAACRSAMRRKKQPIGAMRFFDVKAG